MEQQHLTQGHRVSELCGYRVLAFSQEGSLLPGSWLYNFPPPGFRITPSREGVGFESFFAGASHSEMLLKLLTMVCNAPLTQGDPSLAILVIVGAVRRDLNHSSNWTQKPQTIFLTSAVERLKDLRQPENLR
jgi:hypothetical protein